ncbi:FGGY family carbohydrate kinase [Jiella pelagia]|uniref:FGGY family carbohydrate kinase n=1 Tax=Jiella pelagia TaxID=2986949 RepID=A0ABY7C1Z2_9HYPH|nr:FGGY family carbohydrate kinase [Jiella pelagia]WAP69761.1 FGGY family carbohydrate kinase [Jiella pelagia]
MTDHVIGVDIGTTGTKTGIYDREGRLVGEAFEESILRYPRAGEVEQDPDEIFSSVVNTVREAMARSGLAPDRIAAIALDGQMAGIMAVDADWQPVTHYDSWLDTRCAPWLDELRPHEDDIIRTCGMALAFNHAPKILYWRDRPETWERIKSFIQPAGYVAGKLAGLKGEDAFMDRTYLVFSGFGSSEHAVWNEELLARFGLTTEKLPKIVEPWHVVGTVQPDWAEAMGLAAGTPIAAGCGDQSANVLGGGLVDPGVVFDTSGTASVFATVIDRFGTDTTYRCLMTCPHVVPGLYFPMAYVAGGGLNLRWFRDTLSPREKAEWEGLGVNPYDEARQGGRGDRTRLGKADLPAAPVRPQHAERSRHARRLSRPHLAAREAASRPGDHGKHRLRIRPLSAGSARDRAGLRSEIRRQHRRRRSVGCASPDQGRHARARIPLHGPRGVRHAGSGHRRRPCGGPVSRPSRDRPALCRQHPRRRRSPTGDHRGLRALRRQLYRRARDAVAAVQADEPQALG